MVFPAKNRGANMPRNPKAVLYCNPNAGLIEVATGMSLAGGNIGDNSDGNAQDNCWTDFYTEMGFDVYVFNYAGFGRSFGTTLCVSGQHADEVWVPGCMGRLRRICRASFLTFQVFHFCTGVFSCRVCSPSCSHLIFCFWKLSQLQIPCEKME